MIVQVSSTATVEDWALFLGLPLSDDQRGRLAGLQLTLERGRPLTVDVKLCDNQGGHSAARFHRRGDAWVQAGLDVPAAVIQPAGAGTKTIKEAR